MLKHYISSNEQSGYKLPERDFFFGLVSTLAGDRLKKWIKDFHQTKFNQEASSSGLEMVDIQDDVLDELEEHPYISCKFIKNFSFHIFIQHPRAKVRRFLKRRSSK